MQPLLLEGSWEQILTTSNGILGVITTANSDWFSIAYQERNDQGVHSGCGRGSLAEVRVTLDTCPIARQLWCEVFALESPTDAAYTTGSPGLAVARVKPVMAFPLVSTHATKSYVYFFVGYPVVRSGARIHISVPEGDSTQIVSAHVRRWKVMG